MRYRNRKCKKQRCFAKTNGSTPYCAKHAAELEIAVVRVLTGQKENKDG